MFNIFEHPWGLLTLAVVTLLILLMFHRIFPEKRHWWQWLLPAFLIAAAFGVDALVQTDLEKINAVISTAVKAVEEENPDAVEPIISNNYHDSYHNAKEDLMYYCRSLLSEPLVDKSIKRIVSIDISPPEATAVFTVRIVFDKRSYVYRDFKRLMLAKIELHLRKEQDKSWLINRAEILELDRRPANWRDVR